MRLNKFLSQAGAASSRRKADELIATGVVKVNGKVITELGFSVTGKENIEVCGQKVKLTEFKYVIFYKPAGYITTSDDEKDRKTIYDILPPELKSLKPVGRLDKDSTGLLILTNDGELINQLTHPSLKVPKLYRVSIDGKLTQSDVDLMNRGIEIEPGKTAYAQIRILEIDNSHTTMEMLLFQGLNRQIRKMCQTLGYNVISLKRIAHATLNLDGLKRGEYKPIKPQQIKELRNFLNRISNE